MGGQISAHIFILGFLVISNGYLCYITIGGNMCISYFATKTITINSHLRIVVRYVSGGGSAEVRINFVGGY